MVVSGKFWFWSAGIAALTALEMPADASNWFARYTHSTAGLVCHYNFDEGEGKSVRDQVVSKGALISNTTFVPGYQPQQLIFDGKSKFQFADAASAANRQDMTVSCYVKIQSGGGYFVLKKSSWGLAYDNGNVIAYIYTEGKETVTFPAGTVDNDFHLWTLTVKDKLATVYCDGKIVGRRQLKAAVNYSGELINLGHSDGWKPMKIVGEMRNWRIYSEALSPETIAAHSAAFANGKLPPVGVTLDLELPMGAANSFVGDDIGYEKKPHALRFDGKKSFVQLPAYPALKKPAGLTVGVWIKPENVKPRNMSEQGAIISANAGANAGWTLTTYYNGGISCTLVTDKGKFSSEAFNVLKKGVWQHVGFVWDGNILQVMVNGRPVGQSVNAPGKLKVYTDRPVLGRLADRNSGFFHGDIDELKIYSIGLSFDRDPDTGKVVSKTASNTDVDPRKEPLYHFPGMENAVSTVPVLMDFEDVSEWRIESFKNISDAVFCRSNDDRLWGNYTGKLIVQSGTHFDPERKRAELYPPHELPIEGDFDHVSLWVSAQNWTYASGMKISVTLRDAEGKLHTVPLQSKEHPFVYWSGWGVFVKKLPENIAKPAKLVKLSFYEFNGSKPEVYYLDNLSFFKKPAPIRENIQLPAYSDMKLGHLPGSTVPAAAGTVQTSLEKQGENFVFNVSGTDKIQYIYRPVSGTLSDLRVSFNGAESFAPARNGGFAFVTPDGKMLEPGSSALRAELKSCRMVGKKLFTCWQWSYQGKSLAETTLALEVINQSLAIEFAGGNGKVYAVKTGAVQGIKDYKLNTIPYWVMRPNRGKDPMVLTCDDFFVSCFADIYSSGASDMLGSSGRQADNSAVINGGTLYNMKTDGQRNEVKDLIFINVGSSLNNVLPHLANKPNPTMNITRNGIWVTRMWYDVMPMYDYFDRAYGLLKLYHRYGMRNLFVRDHQTLYRQYSPKRRGGFEGCVDSIHADLGGDKAAAEYFRKAHADFGYRLGLYSNFTLIPPTMPKIFDYNVITLDDEGNPRYGSGETLMYKLHYMLALQRQVNDVLKSKFDLTLSYPDQYTCRAPWDFTDYDADMPEAGKLDPAIRVLAKCSLVERDDFSITLSEGVTQWMFAGIIDSYAQPGSAADPVFPEFQLRQIHMLNNDCGTHLSLLFNGDPAGVDRALAQQLANGTIGHLYGRVGGAPVKKIEFEKLKSYYISKELQKYYAGIAVEKLLYHADGKLLTGEDVLHQGLVGHNQIYIKYANGLQVWSNANGKESWQINANGKDILLPAYGYYAVLPGVIEVGSVMENGRRVDFSLGGDHIYGNGNGALRNWGLFEAENAYAAIRENNAVELIVVPFKKAEKVTVDLDQPYLKGKKRVTALDEAGNALWQKELPAGGKLVIDWNAELVSCKFE